MCQTNVSLFSQVLIGRKISFAFGRMFFNFEKKKKKKKCMRWFPFSKFNFFFKKGKEKIACIEVPECFHAKIPFIYFLK